VEYPHSVSLCRLKVNINPETWKTIPINSTEAGSLLIIYIKLAASVSKLSIYYLVTTYVVAIVASAEDALLEVRYSRGNGLRSLFVRFNLRAMAGSVITLD
jgi:hypothetical protein